MTEHREEVGQCKADLLPINSDTTEGDAVKKNQKRAGKIAQKALTHDYIVNDFIFCLNPFAMPLIKALTG